MKVLFLLTGCDQTGMTTHTLELGKALVAEGCEVTLLIGGGKLNKTKKLYERFLSSGMRVVNFPAPRGSLVQKVWSTLAVAVHILTRRYDVIHAQSPYLSFIPWMLGRRFVSTLHVNDLVRCFYYKNATRLIAISRETRDYAKRVFGYRDEDISIVNHGVDLRFSTLLGEDEKREKKRQLGLPEDKIIIGLVGSIERRKGHDLLLQAVAALPEARRERVHLVFLGSSKNGKTGAWLADEIARSGLGAMVTRFEYQDPEVFYKLFDIFVLPSRLEGFPVVVLEAMLSGCCCVRSNTEGASEQIDSGETGFIFESEQTAELSAILSRLIASPDLMKAVADRGRAKALGLFTSRVMARNTLEVYKKVIR